MLDKALQVMFSPCDVTTLRPGSTASIFGTCPCTRPVVGSKVSHYASALDAMLTWCLN